MPQVRAVVVDGAQYGPYKVINELPYGKVNGYNRMFTVLCAAGKEHIIPLATLINKRLNLKHCPKCEPKKILHSTECRAVAYVNAEREKERLRNERISGVKRNDQVATSQI